MKKFVVLMLMLLMAFSLTACGGEKKDEDTKMVCSVTLENGIQMKNEIIANGNQVKSIAYNNYFESDESFIGIVESEAIKYDEIFNKLKGVTYSYEIQDNKFSEKITIDFTVADYSELCDNGLLEKVDGKVPTMITLDKTIEGMENIGCECK